MFRKSILLALACVLGMSAYAEQLDERYYPMTGFFVDFSAGVGGSRLYYGQKSTMLDNQFFIGTPAFHIGGTFYFSRWFGLGTGLYYSQYKSMVQVHPINWTEVIARQDDDPNIYRFQVYHVSGITESQLMHALELPIALRFRAMRGRVGFAATAGLKLGFPLAIKYNTPQTGVGNIAIYDSICDYQVIQESGVPLRDNVNQVSGSLKSGAGQWLRTVNMVGYAEIGMAVRISQRSNLYLQAFANYYINDVLSQESASARAAHPLGFASSMYRFDASNFNRHFNGHLYDGVLLTNEVYHLHPWSVGLKLSLDIYTGYIRRIRPDKKDRPDREYVPVVPSEPSRPGDNLVPVEPVRQESVIEVAQADTPIVLPSTEPERFEPVKPAEQEVAVKQEPVAEPVEEPLFEPEERYDTIVTPNERPYRAADTIVVRRGMHLSKIARRYYQNVHEFWIYIFDANRDILSNPNRIYPGQTIIVPDLTDYLDGDHREAAIREAARLEAEYKRIYGRKP